MRSSGASGGNGVRPAAQAVFHLQLISVGCKGHVGWPDGQLKGTLVSALYRPSREGHRFHSGSSLQRLLVGHSFFLKLGDNSDAFQKAFCSAIKSNILNTVGWESPAGAKEL